MYVRIYVGISPGPSPVYAQYELKNPIYKFFFIFNQNLIIFSFVHNIIIMI